MAFTNQTNLTGGTGSILQTIFTGGVTVNANRSFPEIDTIRQLRISKSQAREVKFMIETALGYAAIQARNPGTGQRVFPTAQPIDISEKTAQFKEQDITIEVPQQVVDAEKDSPEKYESLLALEMAAKSAAASRLDCAEWYLDGTGVKGTTSSVAAVGTLASTGQVDVTMRINDADRGHAGQFEIGDIYAPKQLDGTTRTVSGSPSETVLGYKVLRRNHRTQIVRFQIVGVAPTYTAVTGVTSTNVAVTDLWYRIGQPTGGAYGAAGIDLTTVTTPSDYDTVSECCLGLESLSANDGRVVQGITMAGATSGTRFDNNAAAVSAMVLEDLLSDGNIAVGAGVMSWPIAVMHPMTRSAVVKERETDRRFNTAVDGKRGTKYLEFQHEDQAVRLQGREYCHPKRIFLLPVPVGGDRQKPLALVGGDYKPVRAPGATSDWHLKATSSGYVAAFQSFMHRRRLFLNTYPAAILVATNFTNT